MRRWEWAFPALAAAAILWATLPDLPHFCGWLEFSRTCGIGAVFRLDVLLPGVAVLAAWGWVRTVLLARDLRAALRSLGGAGP